MLKLVSNKKGGGRRRWHTLGICLGPRPPMFICNLVFIFILVWSSSTRSISNIKNWNLKNQKLIAVKCPLQGLYNSTTLMQIQSGRTVYFKTNLSAIPNVCQLLCSPCFSLQTNLKLVNVVGISFQELVFNILANIEHCVWRYAPRYFHFL